MLLMKNDTSDIMYLNTHNQNKGIRTIDFGGAIVGPSATSTG